MNELWHQFSDLFLHLPDHLEKFSVDYPTLVYVLLGAIVFCETGLVVMPFLPGDSLLFACGMLAWRGQLNVVMLAGVFVLAALLGDNCNYWLGRALGPKILRGEKIPLLNRKSLDRTHKFFERHGGKAVVMARFVPIIRTFAPFTAGVGTMNYGRFIAFSLGGAVLWVAICVGAGWFLGKIELVREHFDLAVIIIIMVSLIPMAIGLLRAHKESREEGRAAGRVGGSDDRKKRDAA